jgi:tripartite ATP-independent transporter DctM subunit
MDPALVTLIMFGGLILLLIIGVPLAWALSGISILMMIWKLSLRALLMYITTIFGAAWNEIFITIVLFIGMGFVMERAGISEGLFESGYRIFGRLRGGLAMGTVVICAIFAAMAGVTSAACVTMGMIAMPAMIKRGYSKGLAIGSVVGPSTLGILIPPSVVLVFLALLGGISVGKLFAAGLGPGALMTAMFIAYIAVKGMIHPESAPAIETKYTLKEKLVSLKAVILPVFIILGVLGSIFGGVATPTEAAAVGLLFVFISAAINRKLNWALIRDSAVSIFRVTGMIMWISFGALSFAATFNMLGGTNFVKGVLLGLETSPWFILIGIMVLSFLLGMFVEAGAIVWIVTPIAYPIIRALEFDLYWFSILFNMVIMTGYITPPFGFNLFYLKSVAPPEVSLGDIYKSVWPFLAIMVLCIVLVMIFPGIALWFPSLIE